MSGRLRQLAKKHDDFVRQAVISEWDSWASRRLPTGYRATGDDEMRFFSHIRKDCPHLMPDGRATPGRPCMDGCYWSGGSEITRLQLDQRGDADSILPVRFEGIAKTGVCKGRPPSIFDRRRPGGAMKAQGMGATEIAKALGIGRASVYRAL